MAIKRLLIANRGEIAVRIIRACKELQIHSIQVYSEADKDSLPVKMADESVKIGGIRAGDSYLNIDNILAAAKNTRADAVHPGYGFLAENAEFAEQIISVGLKFVGPLAETIRQMGDKISAVRLAKKIGIAVVPGSGECLESCEQALASIQNFGFPVMIKATAGGGGKGIRVAENAKEFEEFFYCAKTETQVTFGDGRLYIEALIRDAHHIEVQILGDGEKSVHCFERQCSLQRRRQKVWEEAPAGIIPEKICEKIRLAAVKIADAVSYRGAGTVEFLYDRKQEKFYFIEMNTRIQVEHPVTEMITGIDLIKEMICLADGESLHFSQNQITKKGHAIEIRINAEDPENRFMPSPGKISTWIPPAGPGVRIDSMIYSGYQVSPFYDSMIGKLIVWDETRKATILRLKRALDEIKIEGIKTTIPLFKILVNEHFIKEGDFNTNRLEDHLTELFDNPHKKNAT